MAELMDTLNQLLEQQTGQISSRIGADEDKTRSAVHAAVPALLAAFSQEAERGGGIRQAIERDHDGAIIDQLSQYLGGDANLGARTTNGAGILDQRYDEVFGFPAPGFNGHIGLRVAFR